MLLLRRGRPSTRPRAPVRGAGADTAALVGESNDITADDHYYAWQLARIVAHLHELRRRRRARRARRYNQV